MFDEKHHRQVQQFKGVFKFIVHTSLFASVSSTQTPVSSRNLASSFSFLSSNLIPLNPIPSYLPKLPSNHRTPPAPPKGQRQAKLQELMTQFPLTPLNFSECDKTLLILLIEQVNFSHFFATVVNIFLEELDPFRDVSTLFFVCIAEN
jgi:hypothetical protein